MLETLLTLECLPRELEGLSAQADAVLVSAAV